MELPYQLSQLPKEIQQQVLDYIEFLLTKYQTEKGPAIPGEKKTPLKGMVLEYKRATEPIENDWEAAS